MFRFRLESSIDRSKWFTSRKGKEKFLFKLDSFYDSFSGRLILTSSDIQFPYVECIKVSSHDLTRPSLTVLDLISSASLFRHRLVPRSNEPLLHSPLFQDGILHFRFVSRPSNYPLSTMLSTQTAAKQRQKEGEYNRIENRRMFNRIVRKFNIQ